MKSNFNAAGKTLKRKTTRAATRPTTRPPKQRRKKRPVVTPDDALLQAIAGKVRLGILSALARGADVNTRNKDGVAAIHFAAKTGDVELLKALLEREADIDVVPLNHDPPVKLGSYTPLVGAIMNHHHDFARVLIEAGADVNLGAEWGDAPLQWAVWEGSEATVRMLVEHGADIEDRKPDGGETPLCMAVTMGWEGIVGFLLSKGADVQARMDDGKTLLMVAAENGHEGIAQTLIDHGVSISARDEQGRDAVDIARDDGRMKMAEKLGAMISRHNAQKIKTLFMKRHNRPGI